MNETAPAETVVVQPQFRKRRMFKFACMIFVGQWLLFLLLGLMDREQKQPPPALLAARLGGADGDELVEAADPGVFSGAHQRGFSVAALPQRRGDSPIFEPKIIAPTFISPSPATPPDPTINRLAAKSPRSPELRAEPALAQPVEGLPGGPSPTMFSFSGPLKNRPLLLQATPAPQYYSDVLSNSVVQIAVTSDGDVFSTRLASSSGSRKADLDALALAAKLRFAPAPQSLQQGEWIVRWQTLSPAK